MGEAPQPYTTGTSEQKERHPDPPYCKTDCSEKYPKKSQAKRYDQCYTACIINHMRTEDALTSLRENPGEVRRLFMENVEGLMNK